MKKRLVSLSAVAVLASGYAIAAFAQGMPTKQPALLTIVREEIKPGRSDEHAKNEAGWPAAYEKAKSPYHYLALTSVTGTNEALYVVPFESHAAIADSMKRDDADPVLSAELARLSRLDAEYVSAARVIRARARTDLSMGEFPDLARTRFYQISFFRVRTGQEAKFDAAVKAYQASAKRLGIAAGTRVYQVVAGMSGATFVLFSSVEDYAEFDKMMADGQKIWGGMSAEERGTLQKFAEEALVNAETNHYRVDPKQSYVDKETKSKAPDFWTSK